MAITITSPTTANIADNTTSVSVNLSGTIRPYIYIALRINGITVSEIEPTSLPANLPISAAVQAIYNAAAGSTRTGCVSIYALTSNEDKTNPSSATLTGGTLTINYRMGGLTLTKPLSSNKWNMDLTTGNTVNASWSRTNTAAFYARLKGYVFNGSSWTQVFNRYGFGSSTGIDMDSFGYHDAIVAAMNGVTPRDFMLQVITQFNDGTADYEDLSYTATEGTNQRTTTGGSISKTFFTPSTITTASFTINPTLTNVPFTLTHHSTYSHSIKLYVNNILIRTETYTPVTAEGTYNGNFTITATERTAILNAMPSNMIATSYAEVTENGATKDSKAYATSATISSTDYKPVIGTINWAESAATTYVKTVLGYSLQADAVFLTAKSKVTFTVPTTMATGASLVSIRVQFAGTDQSTAISPVTTSFLQIASLTSSYTVTVTDSRGQQSTSTGGSIKVKAYTYPTVDKFEVYRANTGSTLYAPLGTYLRSIYKATAFSVTNATGVEKNWVRVRIDSKVATAADNTYVNKLATAGTTLTIPETIAAEYSGYLTTTVYSIRIRVYDAFYDLDNDASILEDTDDYSQNVQTLPYGKVSMMLGDEYMSVGKVWTEGGLDVAGNIVTTGSLKSTVAAGTAPLIVASNTKVTNLNADLVDGYSVSEAATPSTVVARTASNYIYATFYNSNRSDETSAAASYIYDTGDGWMRKKTVANVKTELGIPTYAEGTFTPTVIGATSAGAGTYTLQKGNYTKIGNVVYFGIHLTWTAHTGTGEMRITGLPFNEGGYGNTTVSFYHLNVTLSASGVLQGYVYSGSNTIYMRVVPVAGGTTTLQQMDTAASMEITGFYFV